MSTNDDVQKTVEIKGTALAILLGLPILGNGGATYFGVNSANASLERELYGLKATYLVEIPAVKERVGNLESDVRILRDAHNKKSVHAYRHPAATVDF